MKSKWVWVLSAAIVLGGIVFALLQQPRRQGSAFADPQPGQSGSETDGPELKIAPKNAPVVTGFVGDLLLKGNPEDEGKVIQPFVAGETLKLQAEAHNAVEYRWTVNGQALKEKEQDWSPQPERFYDVIKPGNYMFAVQVRGGDKNLVSLEKRVELNILPLKIVSLEKNLVHSDDERFITGDDINLDVTMAQNMGADPDFYQFRYFVNDEPVKHPDEDPDDDGEWTHNASFSYTFPTPGNYTFKVEARRSTEKQAEGHLELPETVIVADAVLLSLDSFPDNEKGAAVGTQVSLSSFPTSRYGKSECRFGVKKLNAADYAWLTEESGALWGESYRTWLPTEPGTYLVRCEVRELGKETIDDFREMYFTITDGNF